MQKERKTDCACSNSGCVEQLMQSAERLLIYSLDFLKEILMKTHLKSCFTLSIALLSLSLAILQPANAADHRDAPRINEDPRADINDVYAFVNPNNTNIVLAMTVNPFLVGGTPQLAFSSDVLYQFKIDNTGDYKEDLVIQAVFTPTVPGPQNVTILGPAKPREIGGKNRILNSDRTLNFSGPANGAIFEGLQGMRGFAGLRDDPFFFDLNYVFRLLGILPGGPIPERNPGIDLFAGFNVSIVAVEVPPDSLRGSLGSGNVIHFWGTTSRPKTTVRSSKAERPDYNSRIFAQVERMGKPTINTVLISKAQKDEFNRAQPSQDQTRFFQMAVEHLVEINHDEAYSQIVAGLLLPDVLTLDMTSTAGFELPSLNGRRPQDDIINTILNAGSYGAVTSDHVDNNDVPFLQDFPFFAPPHAASEPLPPRNLP
jgi:hypothetical protein